MTRLRCQVQAGSCSTVEHAAPYLRACQLDCRCGCGERAVCHLRMHAGDELVAQRLLGVLPARQVGLGIGLD